MTQRIGDLVIIEPEDDRECELCGKEAETRPYGPNGERVCFECGQKNPEAIQRGIRKLLRVPPVQ
jgi:hypothetical protein